MERDQIELPVTPSVRRGRIPTSGRVNEPRSGNRLIKPAVVTITSKQGGATYEILRMAREKICLKDLGIENTIIKRAVNGAIVIQVPGPQGRELASSLSSYLAGVLGDSARVSNPVATGVLRIRGIDPSVTMEEIHAELEALSGCLQQDLRLSSINFMRDSMGVAWIVCPLETAVRLAEMGTVRLGWTRVRIDLLKRQPFQCFRCWHFGHVRGNCRAEVDRTAACSKCGQTGHVAGNCNKTRPKCIICEDIGAEFAHKLGSTVCLRNQGVPGDIQLIKKTGTNTVRRAAREEYYNE